MSVVIEKAVIWQGTDAVCMARVVKSDGTHIEADDIESIICHVFDVPAKQEEGDDYEPAEFTPVVAESVFDTLQTDSRWSKDSVGYNFRYAVPGEAFPAGNRIYVVQFELQPITDETSIKIKFQPETAEWWG